MPVPPSPLPSAGAAEPPGAAPAAAPPAGAASDALHRNFRAWVAYQFFFRIGWQFKMESTLMAGIVSYLAPDPRLMGLFTTVNAFGRNLSPLAAAPIVDRFRSKRAALLGFWGLTVGVWAALALYLWLPIASRRGPTLAVFAVCYTLFFALLGATTVAQGALLGKIIPADLRGRAMALGMSLAGALNIGAILLVAAVVQGGHFPEPRNYALAFSISVLFFALAGLSLLFIREEPSRAVLRGLSLRDTAAAFVRLARKNADLRRLLGVNLAVAVGANMLQFYTAYWREAGTLTPQTLLAATICQVFWQCLASGVLGRVADARGNRLVVGALLWTDVLVPLSAWLFGGASPFRQHWVWYLGVYTMVGIRFPLYQLLVNYLLEVVPQDEHAMALGAVTGIQLLAAPAPILLGAAAEAWGYPAAFALGAAVAAGGALLGIGLREVRVRCRA